MATGPVHIGFSPQKPKKLSPVSVVALTLVHSQSKYELLNEILIWQGRPPTDSPGQGGTTLELTLSSIGLGNPTAEILSRGISALRICPCDRNSASNEPGDLAHI